MDDMKFEVAKGIQMKLKEKVNASVFVGFDNETLEVRIRKGDLVWHSRFYDAVEKAVTSFNFEKMVVDQVVADYKKYINTLYFY